MFPFGDRLFFDVEHRRGMSRRRASFSFAEWALAREFSLQCSVPLAAQGDVECLVGSTSLLDVEGVMLKIQTWSEKKKLFPRLVQEHTYVGWKHVLKYKTLLLRNKTFCSKLVGVSAQDVGNMTGMLPRDWIALNIVMAQPEALHCRTLTRQGSLRKMGWKQMPQRHPPTTIRVEEKSLTKEKHVTASVDV